MPTGGCRSAGLTDTLTTVTVGDVSTRLPGAATIRPGIPIMLARVRNRFDYADVPTCLRRYLVAVSVGGLAVTVGLAVVVHGELAPHHVLLAIVLVALAAVAERYPLHLTHKTNINLGTAAYVAMLLTLPLMLPAVLALVASAGAQTARMRSNRNLGFSEPAFNVAQTALYVAAAVPVFTLLRDMPLGPSLGDFGSLGAVVAASLAMHLVNTGLVSVAAGLQMGISPLRVWWHNLALDLTPHITLTVLGFTAAYVADAQPLLLPVLAVPGVLVQRSVAQTVRLRVDTHEALASLVEVVELRDSYTAGHSRRVATTARLIALQLGLTAEEADIVESAGRVHDIGKVAVDPLILVKRGKLTADECGQMRQHPTLGANVVERFAAYQRGTAFVRHHHEAWDGSGYPDGQAGEAIPLGARILAVADTFDALTSDRPYRDGMAVAQAMAILDDGAGRQWDPRAVEALRDLLRETPGDVPLFSRDEQTATAASALRLVEGPTFVGRDAA
ncbi:MAG: hypothetical protein QOJ59_2579 [Thermomicrobiales bacterium]|nr:hypothetical protein [Thermomicrobiales bacterium]